MWRFYNGFILVSYPVSYRFHTSFIPRRAIAIQCSGLSFVGCDDKGTNSLGDVAVYNGFIPVSYPVSYRFHTGFIPRRAIAIQCSGHSFVGCDDKGKNSLGDVAVL